MRGADRDRYKDVQRDLGLALSEIEKALATKDAPPPEDLQQLSELCRGLAERINRAAKSFVG